MPITDQPQPLRSAPLRDPESPAEATGELRDVHASNTRAAWILVGGKSSRMGTDKARADSGGIPLALRVAERLARVVSRVSLVGDPALYAALGLPVIPDTLPGNGPLAGMEAALAASKSANNLIVACDMPSLDEQLIAHLFVLLETTSGDGCAIPIHPDGHLEPLCAVYHKNCHPIIRDALLAGIRKVTDIPPLLETRGFAVRYVRVADAAQFENLNTPDDWRRYHNGR